MVWLSFLGGGFGPFVIVGFVILAIVLVIVGHLQAEKRRQAMAELARSMDLSFQATKDYGMDERFGRFDCFRKGSGRYAHNIMTGRIHDRDVWAFDFHYETHSRDSKGRRRTHHHYFSALIIDSGLPLQPLLMRPEGFFDKITEFVGFDDIDFESNEFSRSFYVKSPNKKWAFDVIHQETMEFLLEAPRFKIEFQGPYIVAYRSNRFDVKEFGDALAVVEGLLQRFPDYLLRELKGINQ